MDESDRPRAAGRALSMGGQAIAALALGVVADAALASFGGRIELGFGFLFIAAAVTALPGALLCMLVEILGTRRRPPRWLGAVALGLWIYCLLRAVRILAPHGEAGVFLYPLPPLMTLALVTLVPAPRWRLAAVWCSALGAIGLGLLRQQQIDGSAASGTLGALLGGALTSMLLWHLGYVLGQRAQRGAGIAPVRGPDPRQVPGLLASGWRRAVAERPEWLARLLGHPGLLWWFGGAAAFYVGIAVLSALGQPALLAATIAVEWRIADFLGFAMREADAFTVRAWAVHGLPWSAIAGGGVWGAAATAGLFDAGRLQPVRLAAILAAIVMVLWIASVARTLPY